MSATDLAEFERSLRAHFEALRAERDKHGRHRALFALEHGLSEPALSRLNELVRAGLRGSPALSASTVCLVVYATEIGYRYTGEEYWQTFQTSSPRWVDTYAARDAVRFAFQGFAREYRAAKPSGPWAEHFSIICWPITHAVLPTDLQRHLAQLLYEYRRAFTTELLEEPLKLGARLAAMAAGRSSRFDAFAQNASLLGHVAAALLSGSESASELLLPATLERIVADLSEERASKVWLEGARSAANRIRLSGLSRHASTTRGDSVIEARTSHEASQAPLAPTRPFLSLIWTGDAWQARIQLTSLAELEMPAPVRAKLLQSRCLVTGCESPLARGQLLYSVPPVELSRWPSPNASLVTTEGGDIVVDRFLADECRFPAAAAWLFRNSRDGYAEEVRGRTVMPGSSYLIVVDAVPPPLPPWIATAEMRTAGATLLRADVPNKPSDGDRSFLRQLGLGIVSDVVVQAIGPVPAFWDSGGWGEWSVGDKPLLALDVSADMSDISLAIDAEGWVSPTWQAHGTSRRCLIELTDVGIGRHVLKVTYRKHAGAPADLAYLSVVVRAPTPATSDDPQRQAAAFVTDPIAPTLEQIWDGVASVHIVSPASDALIQIALSASSGSILAKQSFTTFVPLASAECDKLLDTVRGDKGFQRSYGDAVAITLTAHLGALGQVALRAGRSLSTLRWASGQDRSGPFVRLHDNSGSQAPRLSARSFDHPEIAVDVQPDTRGYVRFPSGGLVVAEVNSKTAGVVLPPPVKDFTDLRRTVVTPALPAHPRTRERLTELLHTGASWGTASLPGTPFASLPRNAVLRATAEAIAALIEGPRWRLAEDEVREGRPVPRDIRLRLGQRFETFFASLPPLSTSLTSADVRTRVHVFGDKLQKLARPIAGSNWYWYSELLLRLSSRPDSVPDWAGEALAPGVEYALEMTAAFAAARVLVLDIERRSAQADSSVVPYGAWRWA